MKNEKLIVALDVENAAAARKVFEELGETGCAFKIGLQLFTAEGSRFVRELVERGAKIFLDLKFHDIPNTVANAAVEAARLGVFMFNVHAVGGGEMMQRCLEAVRETAARENLIQPKIIAVTVLTSANAETLRQVGIENAPENQVLKLAKLTKECGLDGVVASAQEAKMLRENLGKDFLIVTPGIRLKSRIQNDDQQRILTPFEAIKTGADFIVVGRPILQAANRIETTRKILAEIKTAAAND